MKYEVQLISPIGEIVTIQENGNNINIPYYEIGNYLEKVVDDFISLSSQNKDLFDLFKQGYNHFNPYLDFAITYLGYKIKNPLIIKESILYGFDDKIANQSSNLKIKPKIYKRLTDENYKIDNVNIEQLKDCLIAPNGLKYEANRNENINHEELYEILLIEKMIYDKKLYDDYIYCMTNPNMQYAYLNIGRYLRGRLGFIELVIYGNQSGLMRYNKDLIDDYFYNLRRGINDNYPNIVDIEESLSSYLNSEQIEQAKEIRCEIGEKHESRRI